MRSSGGVATLEEAARACRRGRSLSGPAAGVVGARGSRGSPGSRTRSRSTWAARRPTSALIVGGEAERSSERLVAGLPIRLPSVDLHTVGAGGGSIVWPRCRRRLPGRPGERRRRAGAGLLRPRRHAADGDRREPPARQAAGPPRRRARARPRTRPSARARRDRPGGRDRGRERGDAARTAGGLGRARPRPARLRARRVRRRRAAARLRARRGARDRDGARARGRRRALGARPRASATSGATACARTSCPLDGGRRAARRGRGGPPLRGPVVRADRAARRRPRRARSTARTRSGTATPTATRAIELVAVRTADVRPGPAFDLPRAEPLTVRGPAVLELDGATCWIPPGWVGVRDGP